MPPSSDRTWDDAKQLGHENVKTLELARRHCLNMQFEESGGRGAAEAATGLPINMRQVRCPVAIGDMAMNLAWIAGDFYRQHCVGCSLRRPTGDVPNLATIIEAEDAHAARAAQQDAYQLAAAREAWSRREEARLASSATASEAMTGALVDLGALDPEPGGGPVDKQGATLRLVTLADRAPQVFTAEFVALALELVTIGVAEDSLEVCRHLVQARSEFIEQVVKVALLALKRGPLIPAGRVLADLTTSVTASDLDEQIVRSLIYLAGAPALDRMGRARTSQVNDPTGLRAAADIAPDLVVRVLEAHLPGPRSHSSLIVPGGTDEPAVISTFMRAAAGRASASLAHTHPDVASRVVPSLILDLAVEADDHYDDPARPAIERALAVMLTLGVGDVEDVAESAGVAASNELREPLFRTFTLAADFLDPDARWREPGDPRPEGEHLQAIVDRLTAISLKRLSGDWGDEVRHDAAQLLKSLAKLDPASMLGSLTALLGSVLTLVEAIDAPDASPLDVVTTVPAGLRAMEDYGRRQSLSSTAGRVLDAVETLAGADALLVCSSITALISEERATDRGPNVIWRLLRNLGRLGRRFGDEPGVLKEILPVLHTYLVDADVPLRVGALEAWTEIAGTHGLPSSLTDLLPALAADLHTEVTAALLAAARRLNWPERAKPQLQHHALAALSGLDPKDHSDAFKQAVSTAIVLSRDDPDLLEAVERFALGRAMALDGYDLRDLLRRTWLPTTATSPEMARLRLRQAADPRINDRYNSRDDTELCALLESGVGLQSLELSELTEAALAHAPQYPYASAEFAEVAWRAGRPADAARLMRSVLDVIPSDEAHAWQQRFSQIMIRAAEADAAAVTGVLEDHHLDEVDAAVAELSEDDGEVTRKFIADVQAILMVRRLLTAEPSLPPPGGATSRTDTNDSPTTARLKHADGLDNAATALTAAAQKATQTGAYLRAVAGFCEVGAHLLRADAAVLDADVSAITAHTTAAKRRAALLLEQVNERFRPGDPIASALRANLDAVVELGPDFDLVSLMSGWSRTPLPIPIVRGPQRSGVPAGRAGAELVSAADSPEPSTPVAVVLASIDGRLVTGPEVFRPNTVHDLSVEVQLGPWPDWAERLDAELLTHLTPSDITTPAFTWLRAEHGPDPETYAKSGPLVLRFSLPAGQPAPPLLFKLRWRGEIEGEHRVQELDVTGHRELHLRPFDATRDSLSDYPVFDERLLDLYERLASAGYEHDQLQAFCRLFTAICRVGLRMTWDKEYRRGTRVTERKFHDDLFERLLAEPELEGRLERGSALALGYLDVRHDGITAELKVERTAPATKENAAKYIGQPTQYAAADGARLSILTILDMSPKELPIGTAENYLFTLEPRLHGLDNPEAPSLVTVLIINGNMPIPSSWRRKTPTTETPD